MSGRCYSEVVRELSGGEEGKVRECHRVAKVGGEGWRDGVLS